MAGGWGVWKTISITPWRLFLQDAFLQDVLLSPFEIWGILTGGNREEVGPMRKLRIGMTGNVGVRSAAINATAGGISGIVGGRALVEEKESLVASGEVAEAPSPTYGYLRSNALLFDRKADDLINAWVWGGVRCKSRPSAPNWLPSTSDRKILNVKRARS